MNFYPEKGMERLKALLLERYSQIPEEFYALETRFAHNRKEGSLFGDNEPSIRGEFNRICLELHRFTNGHLNLSFNDLCQLHYPNVRPLMNGQRQSKGIVSSKPVASNTDAVHLDTRKRWAVLIGVGKYDDERYHELPLCVRDVTKIAQQLYSNEGGYEAESIHVLVDDASDQYLPRRDNVLSILQKVADATEPEDLLLFYYTGHGDYVQGESYLVTRDGTFDRLKETALPISDVIAIMRGAHATQKVIILDACHAGANVNSKGSRRMHPKFIERVFMQAQGVEVLSSCEQGQLSYAWERQLHSVFTYFLLEALLGKADYNDKGCVSVNDIYQYVTNGVKSWCEKKNYQQTPTRHCEVSSGEIIVSYYKSHTELAPQPVMSSEASQALKQKRGLVSSTTARSWFDIDTVQVRDEMYMLHKTTIQEKYTRDHQAVLRYARAQHKETERVVWLKQAHIFHPTSQGDTLGKSLREEYRLAIALEQHRDFPRPLLTEGFTGEIIALDTMIVYEAWTGSTLGSVFHQPGKALERTSLVSFLWHIIRVCQALNILHRMHRSHRSLTEDNVIILDADKRRTVLQDLGLAALRAKSGGEQVQIQAPEQQYTGLELGVPGPQTDIYQLGVILYTFITGQPLSSTRPSALASTVSAELDTVIMRAIARPPKDRWPNIMVFASELKKTLR